MSKLERNIDGLDKITEGNGPGPRLMGANWPIGMNIYNPKGEKLGNIKEVMLDVEAGSVAYAVLSFGGFLGIADKLFAVPWNALTLKLETLDKRFILDAEKERLESAPGFDKDNWPDMADQSWIDQIHSYYETRHYMDNRSD
ncbi:PRC-barrel domain-containing protein [Nitrosovibrio sp. Nv4]|uniref:PRC-barrel domain-containing protein n=1 Tax=Nitrosovibrio sp. Nv4 TaxID=1945880 RepID=UPI000BD49D30|nr:PRC-barrel domain-containing protein [Nitrosovibrio sp. Nv4]SOD39932.1 PRC-barrel domain-containing protein [Nitrosovibrio sp. Nv4]